MYITAPKCRGDAVFPIKVRAVAFLSHAWGIRPITMHWIAGQSEHTLLLWTMSFVKINAFQKGRAEGSNNNVRYVEKFFNLKQRNTHQIHKIMLFLATSYDPFKITMKLRTNYLVCIHSVISESDPICFFPSPLATIMPHWHSDSIMENAVTSEDAQPLPATSQSIHIHLREPEDECPSSTSPEPSTPSSPSNQQTQGSAVSALQSKVKALSERRVAWKEPGSKNQDKRVVPGTFMLGYALTDAWGSGSSDEDGEPCKPLMFIARDPKPQVELEYDPISSKTLLPIPRGFGEGASLENFSNDACRAQHDASLSDEPCMAPKYFWRSIRPEMPGLNGNSPVGKDGPNGGTMGLKMGHKFPRELQRSDSLESHLCRYNQSEVEQSGLWRADSLESMCSSGSSLSLAERVEMNRGLLKQMLQKAQNKDHVPGLRIDDQTHIGGRGKEIHYSDMALFF